MPIKKIILKEKAEMTGIFDFKALYSYMYSWFRNKDYRVTEKRYMEEVKKGARFMKIIWLTQKKVSDYFEREMEFEFTVKGMVDVEAEVDGVKKDLNQGSVEIEIKGILVKDPESKWEANPFSRFARDFYNKYIIPARIDKMEGELAEDVMELKEEAKAFLEFSGKR